MSSVSSKSSSSSYLESLNDNSSLNHGLQPNVHERNALNHWWGIYPLA